MITVIQNILCLFLSMDKTFQRVWFNNVMSIWNKMCLSCKHSQIVAIRTTFTKNTYEINQSTVYFPLHYYCSF